MPLALTIGADSQAVPFAVPAIQNINGQALTLHLKHKDVKGPADMKGFVLAVPFEHSMHNFLLRYFLGQGRICRVHRFTSRMIAGKQDLGRRGYTAVEMEALAVPPAGLAQTAVPAEHILRTANFPRRLELLMAEAADN